MVLRYSASYSSWECMIEQNFLADLCIQLEDSTENEVWSFFLFLGQFKEQKMENTEIATFEPFPLHQMLRCILKSLFSGFGATATETYC